KPDRAPPLFGSVAGLRSRCCKTRLPAPSVGKPGLDRASGWQQLGLRAEWVASASHRLCGATGRYRFHSTPKAGSGLAAPDMQQTLAGVIVTLSKTAPTSFVGRSGSFGLEATSDKDCPCLWSREVSQQRARVSGVAIPCHRERICNRVVAVGWKFASHHH